MVKKICSVCQKEYDGFGERRKTCSRECSNEWKKQQIPWNKGIPHNKETKEKLSIAIKKQYEDGTRDRFETTKKANEAKRAVTKQREISGNMNSKIDAYGYKIIYTTKGWVKEHHYIWEKHNGPRPNGYVIHHINGIKTDNRIENLLMLKQGQHMKDHNIPRGEKGMFKRRDE